MCSQFKKGKITHQNLIHAAVFFLYCILQYGQGSAYVRQNFFMVHFFAVFQPLHQVKLIVEEQMLMKCSQLEQASQWPQSIRIEYSNEQAVTEHGLWLFMYVCEWCGITPLHDNTFRGMGQGNPSSTACQVKAIRVGTEMTGTFEVLNVLFKLAKVILFFFLTKFFSEFFRKKDFF